MKSSLKGLISAFLAFLIIIMMNTAAFADPTDETTADQTQPTSQETVASPYDDQIITLEEYPTAFLSEDLLDAPTVSGKGYLLFDVESQTYLLGKDIDTPLEPASTTKLMTVLLAFEKIHWQIPFAF